nr:hypothetical protein [Tanacetum cinerariifolium]
ELNTIPEKESDEFIKSSVEDLVLIPSESEDTSEIDSECILPSCDDFSPTNVFEEKSVTFSDPLFSSNNNFTFSDDESLSDEGFLKDKFKIYSNPLFEFDDEYISSDESTIPLNEIISQLPPSIVITTSPPVLPIEDLEVSLIMGNKELNTIPEKESDEFIKSSVEDLVLIPRALVVVVAVSSFLTL